MLKVGLTGNIASGKSAVAAEWQRLGAAVIDADALAREAVAPGTPGLAAVVAAFGDGVLRADGTLDRAALRGIVFADPVARARLESIVHPGVARLRAEREAALEQAGEPLVINVIPLLFEVGLEDAFDEIVLVDAPESVRRRRLVELRGLDEREAARMIEAQMPAEAKRGRATFVIENRGTLEELRTAARAVLKQLEAKAR